MVFTSTLAVVAICLMVFAIPFAMILVLSRLIVSCHSCPFSQALIGLYLMVFAIDMAMVLVLRKLGMCCHIRPFSRALIAA